MIFTPHSKHKGVLIFILAVALVLGFVFLLLRPKPVENIPGDNQPVTPSYEPYRATLTGTYLCLPHKDTTGPQTEECASGLKTDDGTYYALDLYLMSQMSPPLTVGDRLTANGLVTPVERLSTMMWRNYPIKAVFSVTDSLQKEGQSIFLYYYNPSLDQGPGGPQCSEKGLVSVERIISPTETPLTDAVKLLLYGGLSPEETTQGLTTEFPLAGVTLEKAEVKKGVAELTFADRHNKTVGGACRVTILRMQIEAVAKQFDTV